MSAEASDSPLFATRAARVTLVMSCLFAVAGVVLVFLPRWLEVERGLTGAQIGVVLSLAQVARILTGPLIAYWADGTKDRRTPLRLISLAALAGYAAFFFFAQGFWALLIFGFIALSLTQVMTPLVEAAVLRSTAEGKLPYGTARAIGSIAFIVANVAGGLLIARFGLFAVVAWVMAGLLTMAASSWLALLPDPARSDASTPRRSGGLALLLTNRRFLIVIVSCGLIQSAHAFYYGFSTLVWRAQGLSPELVGLLWAFGVGVEVAFLLSLTFIERRVSAEVLILLGAAGALVRWSSMGFGPTGLILWPLQALHALSFAAAHIGAMRLIYREAPDEAAGMAQTLYSALSGGILMGGATLLSGLMYDQAGPGGYWAMAVLTLAGGLLALQLRPGRRPPPG